MIVTGVSSRIKRLLTEGEVVRRRFDLKGRFRLRPEKSVYATNVRLIIDEKKSIREISYQHISSMEIKNKINKALILIGLLVMIIGLAGLLIDTDVFKDIFPDALAGAFMVLGLVLAIYGFIPSKVIEITIVGMLKPYPLEGRSVELEEIFILVRDSTIAPDRRDY